jgi:hypothetical protein
MAALAAKEGHHVMSIDHRAAYLNADMTGSPVEMLFSPEVAEILCGIDIKYGKYVRKDGSTKEGALWLRPKRSIMV